MEFSSLHFTGIGGSGMSSLAQVLRAQGFTVSGSDRTFDVNQKNCRTVADMFSRQGICIYPQDGTGVKEGLSALVVSTAIEETNPDVIKAKQIGLKIITRAQMLSYVFNNKFGIAVGGTSGKSTVAAMIAFVLRQNDLDPVYIGGGIIKNFESEKGQLSNALCGASDIMCVETDESDGSIVLYTPRISILTNITKDHKEVPELQRLFAEFIRNTRDTIIINYDCPLARKIDTAKKNLVTYGIEQKADITARHISLSPEGSSFSAAGADFQLRVLGVHNISNALAAIAACRLIDLPLPRIASALAQFNGIKRRIELIGEANGIKVYDDFSHNGAKIRAALAALKAHARRVIAVFQPHGYAPTRLMKEDFISAFSTALSPGDVLFMAEIFDAGGTADRTISSRELAEEIGRKGIDARYVSLKEEIKRQVLELARPGDTVVVMGARDTTLSQFCEDILKSLG
jgi:UDP-N-acetylmuramate--alanine ligase